MQVDRKIFLSFFKKSLINKMAINSGFVKRFRYLDPYYFFLSISFATTGTSLTLDAMIETLIKKISKTGLNKRFNSQAVDFMKKIFEHTLKIVTREAHHLDDDMLNKFNNIKIIDSSSWKIPKIMKSIFPGFNGAGIKIQLAINYVTGIISYFDITEEKCPDQKYASTMKNFVEAGDLLIFDLGYAINAFLNHIAILKAFFVCRFNHRAHAIYIKKGDEYIQIDTVKLLNKFKDNTIYNLKCYIGSQTLKTEVKLVALKVPSEIANKRRMKLKRARQRRRVPLNQKSLDFCDWSIFITNVTDNKLESREILALYKIRWTVEIYFKQFKSIVNIHKNHLKKNECRLQCEILGKMIVSIFTSFCYSIARANKWKSEKKEISFEKFVKFFTRNTYKIFQKLSLSCKCFAKNIYCLMKQSLKICIKGRQKTRVNSLDLLITKVIYKNYSCETIELVSFIGTF